MSRAQHFIADRRGGVAFFFSLSLLPLMAIAGAGFRSSDDEQAQEPVAGRCGGGSAARGPGASTCGNQEITTLRPLPNPQHERRSPRRRARSHRLTSQASLADANSAVQVNVSGVFEPKFLHFVYKQSITLAARAIARTRGFPICILALEDDASGAIDLRENAKVSARSCLVQSNSRNPQGLSASYNANS